MKVSVVVPAYNEEEGIEGVVKDLLDQGCVNEVVVVNNNSTDQTERVATKTGARVVQEKNQVYGYAIQKGILETRNDLVVLTEGDGTFVGRDIPKLLAYIGDADMVLGTRTTLELLEEGAKMGRFLRWGNVFIAKLIQLFYGCRLTDVGCTFRAFHREAYEKIRHRIKVGGPHFSPEMIIEMLKADMKVIEIPVHYRKRVGKSKITSTWWKSLMLGFRMIWLITWRRISA